MIWMGMSEFPVIVLKSYEIMIYSRAMHKVMIMCLQ